MNIDDIPPRRADFQPLTAIPQPDGYVTAMHKDHPGYYTRPAGPNMDDVFIRLIDGRATPIKVDDSTRGIECNTCGEMMPFEAMTRIVDQREGKPS